KAARFGTHVYEYWCERHVCSWYYGSTFRDTERSRSPAPIVQPLKSPLSKPGFVRVLPEQTPARQKLHKNSPARSIPRNQRAFIVRLLQCDLKSQWWDESQGSLVRFTMWVDERS